MSPKENIQQIANIVNTFFDSRLLLESSYNVSESKYWIDIEFDFVNHFKTEVKCHQSTVFAELINTLRNGIEPLGYRIKMTSKEVYGVTFKISKEHDEQITEEIVNFVQSTIKIVEFNL